MKSPRTATARKLSLKYPMPLLRTRSLTLTCCLVTCCFVLDWNIKESSCYFQVLVSWVLFSQMFPVISIIKFPLNGGSEEIDRLMCTNLEAEHTSKKGQNEREMLS